MSGGGDVSPALLASADQRFADNNAALDHVVGAARDRLADDDPTMTAAAVMHAILATDPTPHQIAALAATAVVRLARQPPPAGER